MITTTFIRHGFKQMTKGLSMKFWTSYLLASFVLYAVLHVKTVTSAFELTTFATNTTTSSDDTDCVCDCNNVLYVNANLTEAELLAEIQKIYDKLLLNKDNISATVRKRISVPDYRPSAQSIGYVGVLVLVTSIGSIIALDFSTLLRDIRAGFETLRNFITRTDSNDMTYRNLELDRKPAVTGQSYA